MIAIFYAFIIGFVKGTSESVSSFIEEIKMGLRK
jgi:hypothetical protein